MSNKITPEYVWYNSVSPSGLTFKEPIRIPYDPIYKNQDRWFLSLYDKNNNDIAAVAFTPEPAPWHYVDTDYHSFSSAEKKDVLHWMEGVKAAIDITNNLLGDFLGESK